MKKLIIILALFLLAGCKQEALLQNLDQTQANEVIALLQRNNIKAVKNKTAKEGYAIYVDARDFVTSVDLINSHGLPRPPRLNIADMFPADALVSSPRAEKARLYSGIEQRLTQSLYMLNGVIAAQVHISYDTESREDERKKKPLHLSAMINYDDSVSDPTLLIGDIKKFLKNSVEDVSYDNISVVLSKAEGVHRTLSVMTPEKTYSSFFWIMTFLAGVFGLGLLTMVFLQKKNPELAEKIRRYGVKTDRSTNQASPVENGALQDRENVAAHGTGEPTGQGRNDNRSGDK